VIIPEPECPAEGSGLRQESGAARKDIAALLLGPAGRGMKRRLIRYSKPALISSETQVCLMS